MRKVLLVIPVAATAAVLAGCGSSSKTGSPDGALTPTTPASSTATVTDTVVPPTTTTTTTPTTVVAGPAACATANVQVTLGAADGAAGSAYYPLHFTNKGSSACTITGYPGVSFVAPGSGAQVGAPAQRSGAAGATVTLAPGAVATSVLQVADYANFDPSTCAATAVAGFRVYVPGNTAASAVQLPTPSMACSKDVSGTGSSELLVRAVVAGSTGM